MSIHRVNNIDTNIQNYTLSELMAIAELQELEPNEIVRKTNTYIKKFEKTDPILSAFFVNLQSQLLMYSKGLISPEETDTTGKIVVEVNKDKDKDKDEGFQNMSDAYNPSNNQQQSDWDENQYLEQDDPNQTQKITNRQQTTQTFGNNQVPMKQQQIATTDTFNLPVKQDSLNPNLKNIITRFVNLDSQFRKYTNGPDSSSTDYTLDLSDTLKDALSLRLYSFQIPFSWYAIDKYYGNTCFWIIDTNYNIAISISSGNYTQSEFITQLSLAFTAAGFDLTTAVIPVGATAPAKYNSNNGKITLYLNGVTYNPTKTSVLFTITPATIILFYDFSGKLLCQNNCYSKNNYYLNSTLGWLMGYRLPYITVETDGNPAPAIIDLNGTKYLILVIDDYNQNHINNSVVSISKLNNTLKIPEYYSGDLTYTCLPATEGRLNNLPELVAETKLNSLLNFQTTNPLNGLIIGGKYEQSFTETQLIVPSAPRQLTKSQIYTINEIIKNKNNSTINYLSQAPTSGNILAILPVKTSVGVPTGNLLVEFAGSIQENKRVYFGPVDIDRMAVKLLDDKGNMLNLNGNDWACTLLCECLYQY
jgi:hypothetical protein